MARRLIKEVQLDEEVFDLKDQEARERITALENGDKRVWFFINDSYGVSEVSAEPFPAQLKNNGIIIDELSVGMMSYGGSGVNVIPQLTNKLASMSQLTIDSITDVVCTIGLNDTWDNYNLINLHTKVQAFIDFVLSRFNNIQRIHLAPIGNEFDNEEQQNRMKLVQHVIKKCVSYNSKVLFVNNSQIAMNCPAYFMNDGVHPNAEGSQMLYDNFINYIRTGSFPINTYSYIHEEDAFGWSYVIDYVGDTCSGHFSWIHSINQFSVTGTNDFDVIYSGLVELPIIKKLQLNCGIILTNEASGIKRGALGLIGLTPNNPTHAGMLLSAHANTGGNTPEYYDHIRFYSSFSYAI